MTLTMLSAICHFDAARAVDADSFGGWDTRELSSSDSEQPV